MKSTLFRLIVAIPLCLSITALSLGYAAPYFHPERFWFLPFIGLIYPVSLILTFVLTAIALWARLKIGILGLIILVFGMGMHMRLVSLNFTKSEAPEGAIKVLSYNVRLFGLYDDPSGAQKNGIFNFIRKESPDIACFQEYFKQDKPTTFETFDSLNAIIKTVDFHERSAHRRRGRKNFGIAIFSKYKMISKGDITFDNQGEMDFNYCIYADIVTQKDTFRIYNVHLQSIRLTEPGSKAKEHIVSTIKESGVKLRNAYLKRAGQSRKVLSHIQKSPSLLLFAVISMTRPFHILTNSLILNLLTHLGLHLGELVRAIWDVSLLVGLIIFSIPMAFCPMLLKPMTYILHIIFFIIIIFVFCPLFHFRSIYLLCLF